MLYCGGASLNQAWIKLAPPHEILFFGKSIGAQKSAMGGPKKAQKIKNYDIKKLGNSDCGGASVMDLQKSLRMKTT